MQTIPLKEVKVPRDRFREDVKDIDKLMASISEYGVLEPILLDDDNRLVAGFRRFTATTALGLEEIPYRNLGELSELDRRRVELEENIQRQQMSWAEEQKAIAEIHRLRVEEDPDWSKDQTAEVVGKSQRSVYNALEIDEAMQEDPELQNAKTLVAALQELKRKKHLKKRESKLKARSMGLIPDVSAEILVGDALERIRELEDGSIDAIITNPPFGINLNWDGKEPYDDDPDEISKLIHDLVPEFYRVLAEDSWAVVFWDVLKLGTLANWMIDAGFEVNHLPCVWVKPNKTQGPVRDPWGLFIMAYEAFIFARKGEAHLSEAGRQNIFIYDTPSELERVHPVQMSDALCADIASLVTIGGETVLDPFAGSGAIGVGAVTNECNFIGFELNEKYAKYGNMRLKEMLVGGDDEEGSE